MANHYATMFDNCRNSRHHYDKTTGPPFPLSKTSETAVIIMKKQLSHHTRFQKLAKQPSSLWQTTRPPCLTTGETAVIIMTNYWATMFDNWRSSRHHYDKPTRPPCLTTVETAVIIMTNHSATMFDNCRNSRHHYDKTTGPPYFDWALKNNYLPSKTSGTAAIIMTKPLGHHVWQLSKQPSSLWQNHWTTVPTFKN